MPALLLHLSRLVERDPYGERGNDKDAGSIIIVRFTDPQGDAENLEDVEWIQDLWGDLGGGGEGGGGQGEEKVHSVRISSQHSSPAWRLLPCSAVTERCVKFNPQHSQLKGSRLGKGDPAIQKSWSGRPRALNLLNIYIHHSLT